MNCNQDFKKSAQNGVQCLANFEHDLKMVVASDSR